MKKSERQVGICSHCGSDKVKYKKTKVQGDILEREMQCKDCKRYTYEEYEVRYVRSKTAIEAVRENI